MSDIICFEIRSDYFVSNHRRFRMWSYYTLNAGCPSGCTKKIIRLKPEDFPGVYPVNRTIRFKCSQCNRESESKYRFVDKR